MPDRPPPRFRRQMSDWQLYLLLAVLALAGAFAGGWLVLLYYRAIGG